MKVRSIKELLEIALGNKNIHAEYEYSTLPIKQSKFLEIYIGVKLVGYKRNINTSAIKHTMKQHSNVLAEEKRGQIAVVINDFALIPHIVKEPDSIEYLGKNKLTQDVFVYKKRIGICIYIVLEAVKISKKGNALQFCTMYKRKQKTTKK